MKRITRVLAVVLLATAMIAFIAIPALALKEDSVQLTTAEAGKKILVKDLTLDISVVTGKEITVFTSADLRRLVLVNADSTAQVLSTDKSYSYGKVKIGSLLEASNQPNILKMTLVADGSAIIFSKPGGTNEIPLSVTGTPDDKWEECRLLENVQYIKSFTFQYEPAVNAASATPAADNPTQAQQGGALVDPNATPEKADLLNEGNSDDLDGGETDGDNNQAGNHSWVLYACFGLLILLVVLMPILWFLSNRIAKKREKKFDDSFAEQKEMILEQEKQIQDVHAVMSALSRKPGVPRHDTPTPMEPKLEVLKPNASKLDPPKPVAPEPSRRQLLDEAIVEYFRDGDDTVLAPYDPIHVNFDVSTKVSGRIEQQLFRQDFGNYIVLDDSLLIPARSIFDGVNITADFLKKKCNMQLFFNLVGNDFSNARAHEILPAEVSKIDDYYEQTKLGKITEKGK